MILRDLSDINRELRIKVPQRVYLLYGNDLYLKEQYLNRITKMVLPEGGTMMNHHLIQETPINPARLGEMMDQIPFGGNLLIVVKDFTISAQSDKEIEAICQLCQDIAANVVVVFVVGESAFDEKTAKGKKFVGAVDKNGAVFKLGFSKRSELADFIRTKIEKNGGKIELATVYKLIEYCGEGLDLLLSEAEKLSYYQNGTEITPEIVYLVSSPTIEGNIYQISKKILAGNLRGCMEEIDHLIDNRVNPIQIVTVLGYAFGDLLAIKMGMEQGKTAGEIKADLKLRAPEGVVSMQMKEIRRRSQKQVKDAAKLILEGEYTLKSLSSDSRITLEHLVVKVASVMVE